MTAAFRSLRHRNARLYFLGLVVSNAGTWLQATAQAWLVLRLTDSGTSLGVVVAAQFLPMLLLGAWAGALADRSDRRRIVMWTQTGMALQALLLGVLDLTGHVTVGAVYALAVVLGILSAIDTPARRSLIPELVEPDLVQNAMALNTAVMTGSRIVGPALAGLLIRLVGTGWCFVVNGVSFLAILLAVVALDESAMFPSARAERAPGQVREGLRYVWSEPALRLTLLVLLVVSTFTFNYQVTIPLLVERVFGGGAGAFGALLSVTSVGSFLGSLLTASRSPVPNRFLLLCLGGLGVTMLLLAVAPTMALVFVVSVPMGATGAAYIAATSGVLMTTSRPEMRGRVLSLQSIAFLGSTPIGGPTVGWVGDRFGARSALVLGGVVAVGCFFAAALLARRAAVTPVAASDAAVEPAVG